jgi:hypothetical protein
MDKKKSENEEFIEYLEKQVIDEKQLLWRIYNLPMHKRYAIGQMLSLADKVRTGEYHPPCHFGKTELMVGLIGLCTPLIIAIFLLGVLTLIKILIFKGGC